MAEGVAGGVRRLRPGYLVTGHPLMGEMAYVYICTQQLEVTGLLSAV